MGEKKKKKSGIKRFVDGSSIVLEQRSSEGGGAGESGRTGLVILIYSQWGERESRGEGEALMSLPAPSQRSPPPSL